MLEYVYHYFVMYNMIILHLPWIEPRPSWTACSKYWRQQSRQKSSGASKISGDWETRRNVIATDFPGVRWYDTVLYIPSGELT